MTSIKQLQDMASILRRDSLTSTSASGSGHPTTCLSCAEIMSALFFKEMTYDTKNPFNPDNDEFVLSKGHAAPILYSALYHSGCINNKLDSLRKLNSPLEGHPMPRSLDWIKVATGSLGQGLSVGVGMALAARLQKRKFRVYVLLGDSEIAEGSVYEACEMASYYKLNNLCAIVDANRLGQRGETMVGHKLTPYKERFEGFGWRVIMINGHSVKQIIRALKSSRKSSKPTIIIAMTYKGRGVSFLENKEGWHGKALDKSQLEEALTQIPNPKVPKISIKKPKKMKNILNKKTSFKHTSYTLGESVATREAYGRALANLAISDSRILAIDAETSNSTHADMVKEKTPNQFIEDFIAEQNMIGMALGLSVKGFNTFSSSFAAFLSRAHDQIRMAAISSANMTICGSHSGVSIGVDGASQMALEDLGMFRSLNNSKVFYPGDAVSTEKLTKLASRIKGIKYIRTTRAKTPVLYNNKENFEVGDFKIVKSSKSNKFVIASAGITLHEAIKAHNKLGNCAVADIYCVKPFNSKKFENFVKKNGNKLLVVEDHYSEGGIGEMLSRGLANSGIKIKTLSVSGIPHSGQPEELLKKYKIDSSAIMDAVKSF